MPSKKLFRIFEFWYCAHVLWRYDKKSNAEWYICKDYLCLLYELFLGVEVLRLEKTGVANHNRYCCDCFSWYNSSFGYLLSFHKCKPGSNNDRVCDIKTEFYCIYLC